MCKDTPLRPCQTYFDNFIDIFSNKDGKLEKVGWNINKSLKIENL